MCLFEQTLVASMDHSVEVTYRRGLTDYQGGKHNDRMCSLVPRIPAESSQPDDRMWESLSAELTNGRGRAI